MVNDIDNIKSKIKKLLALSKSPNPNEAASALRMAQELMAEYKIGMAGLTVLDIVENGICAPRRNKPPSYEALLIRKTANAFGCNHFHQISWCKSKWLFIGLKHRAEIAAFIGEVLLRKIGSARRKYLKTLKRVRLQAQKIKRADEYCFWWAYAVTQKLPEFAGVSPEEAKEIERYVQANHPGLTDFTPRNRRGLASDRSKGYSAGEGVQLQHGVGVHSQGPLLLGLT